MNGASLTLGLAALAALAGVAPKGTRNLALSDARRRDLDRFAEACGAFTREVGGHEPVDMRRFAKKHGVRYLGSGYKRDVFSVPEGALMVERGHAPYGDNTREATLWAGAPARLAKLLVPVLATADDHRWNLMEEVEVGGKSTKLREEEFQACGLWDFYAPRNLSKDGRLVDYGYIYDPVSWRECLDKGSEQRGSRAVLDESITDRYGHGECHAFTRALMERFPQAKIGVVALDDVYHDDEILHSLIKVDGMLLDAYGWGTTEEKLNLFAFKKTRGSRLVVRPARKEEAAAILKTKGIVDARAAVRLVLDAVGQKGSRATLAPRPPALASLWFHGTTSSFRAFKGNPKSATPSVLGVWLASKREVAEAFARQSYDLRRLGEPRVLTVEADIENPKVYDTYEAFLRDWRDAGRGTTLKRQLMRAGHDGILVRRSTTDVGMERSDLLVFDPKRARVVGEEALVVQGSRAKLKPPTLRDLGLPTVWFHGTKASFTGKLKPNKGMGGACVWLADEAGARAYAGQGPTARLVRVELDPSTRVADLADARDPIVRDFIRRDRSASNLRWHNREEVTDEEMVQAVAS